MAGPLENAKHEIFAQEIAKGSGTEAAMRAAGYAWEGKSALDNASRTKARPDVAARITELLEGAAEKAEITVARVLAELGKIGFANMADYMRTGPDGDPFLDFSVLTRDQAAALAEVTVEDFKDGRGEDARDVRRVKFKLSDKRGALVDIGKHLGMFKEGLPDPAQINVNIGDSDLARLIVFQLNKATKQA